MGTTSKLEYLSQTKSKLKTAINYTGASITNDTFRSYPEKLYNAYINIINQGTQDLFDSLPKVSGTGNNIKLNNTASAPMVLDYNGDTQQDSTTGKQLLNFNETYSTPTNSTVDNDGWITANLNLSSSSSNGYCIYMTAISTGVTIKPNTLYSVFLEIKKLSYVSNNDYISITNANANFIASENMGNKILKDLTANTTYKYNLTTKSSLTGVTGLLRTFVGVTAGSNVSMTYRLSLWEGDISLDNFEYQKFTGGSPAPSPDYPQPIQVVTGRQELEICGKNLVVPFSYSRTNSGIDFTYNLDGSITVDKTSTGTAYAIANADVSTFTTLPAGTYTLSGGTNDIPVRFDDSTGTNIANTTSSTQFTLNQETKGYIQLRIGSGKTFNNVKVYPMIEKGDQATTYEAYTGYTQEINLGKNLLSTSFTQYSANALRSEISNFKSGTYTLSFETSLTPTYQVTARKIIGGTTTDIEKKYNVNTLTFILDEEATLQLEIYKTGILLSDISNAQLEKGGVATSFSAYFTPIELCKIGDYQDYLFYNTPSSPYYNNQLQDYKWYLHKEIGKYTLNGGENETWQYNSSYTFFWTTSITNIDNQPVYTNYYLYNSTITGITGSYGCSVYQNTFRIKNTDYTQPSDLKTWLQSHNTIVYYVLTTSTDTEITNSALLTQLELVRAEKSKSGQTNIMITSDDLPAILNASALKEYE